MPRAAQVVVNAVVAWAEVLVLVGKEVANNATPKAVQQAVETFQRLGETA